MLWSFLDPGIQVLFLFSFSRPAPTNPSSLSLPPFTLPSSTLLPTPLPTFSDLFLKTPIPKGVQGNAFSFRCH